MFDFIKFYAFRRRLKKAMEGYHDSDDPWSAHLQKTTISQFIEEVVPEGDSVLEIGCGDGIFTPYFCSKFNHVHALDISQNAIDKAEDNLEDIHENVSFLCKDIYSFDFSQSYSLITLSFTLDYLGFKKYPKQFIALMHRIARHSNDILIIQPIYSQEDFTRVNSVMQIFKQFGKKLKVQKFVENENPKLLFLLFTSDIPNNK